MTKRGFVYILKCSNEKYYTGSTSNLERRLWEHKNGAGANYIKKFSSVELVYFEEYERIDLAFYREKNSRLGKKMKEALISGEYEKLPLLAKKIWRKG